MSLLIPKGKESKTTPPSLPYPKSKVRVPTQSKEALRQGNPHGPPRQVGGTKRNKKPPPPPKSNLGPSQHEVHPPTAYSMHKSASLVPIIRKELSQSHGSSLCGCRAPKNPWRRLKISALGDASIGACLMCSCMGPSRILTFSSIVSEKMGTGDCDSVQMIVPLLLES